MYEYIVHILVERIKTVGSNKCRLDLKIPT